MTVTDNINIKNHNKYQESSYFGEQPLNRVSFLREDKVFLQEALHFPDTQFIPFFQGEGLVNSKDGSVFRVSSTSPYSKIFNLIKEKLQLDDSEINDIITKGNNPHKSKLHLIFMGLSESTESSENFVYKDQYRGTPFFAINFTDLSAESITSPHDIIPLTFRNIFDLLKDNREASLYSYARMYVQWSLKFKFCNECGQQIQFIHGGSKWTCTSTECSLNNPKQHHNNAAFPRTDPCVITAIVNRQNDKICLARSKRSVGEGIAMYSCVAGFMEPGETIESACQREVWEETGINVELKDVNIVKSQPWPYPQNLMIGCVATVDFNGENEVIDLNHDPELLDAQWFDVKEVEPSVNEYNGSGFLLPLKLDAKKYGLTPGLTVHLPGNNAIAFDLVKHVIQSQL